MNFNIKPYLPICLFALQLNTAQAQNNLNRETTDLGLRHGIEQYESGQYVQAIHSFEQYLSDHPLPMQKDRNAQAPNLQRDLALYYATLAKIKYGSDDLNTSAEHYIATTVNAVHRDRVAFQLAHYYFKSEDYVSALKYYEMVDIRNLNNEEIADAKFEQAYSYFVQSDFDNAYPLFQSIKEIEGGKYYNAGNYYYGLMAYNKKDYDNALKSFKRIDALDEYKDIIPYYIAEIHYFKGEYDQVLDITSRYLNREEKLYYHKELNLLTGQVYFERKKYDQALPYLEYYYDNSEKIRKENLYELAYSYYHLNKHDKAIQMFKPLSNTQDSLGQNSMYLLGDSYMKTGDKAGARNAFAIASGMDFIPAIKQESKFLYSKLSYELGDEGLAAQSLHEYVKEYPNAANNPEAKELLVSLLSKSRNYEAAYGILSEMSINTPQLQQAYQSVTLGRALQLLRGGDQAAAARLLDQSLQYKNDGAVTAVAQFWKSYILYKQKRYGESAVLARSFIEAAKIDEERIRRISKEATLNNAYVHLGYTEMALHQYDQAKSSFAKAGGMKQAVSASGTMADNQSTILEADAAFMSKNFDEAERLYDRALNQNVSKPGYAWYQKALIAGIRNNDKEKIRLLQKVVTDYRNESVVPTAEYELAVTYLEDGSADKARPVLEKIAGGKDPVLAPKALLKLAYAEQETGNTTGAIKNYESFITRYPDHQDRNIALDALRATYIQKGDAEGYHAFLSANNIEGQEEQSQEGTYYEIAENKFTAENYAEAAKAFDQYLGKYPNGTNALKATFFKAESLYETGNMKESEEAYTKVAASGDRDYARLASIRLAAIAYQGSSYDEAIQYANAYLAEAEEEEEKRQGHLILLKSYTKTNDVSKALESIEFLSSDKENLSAADQLEVKNAQALVYLSAANYTEADKLYKELAQSGAGPVAAEARYRSASILFQQNKLKEAEAAADKAIQENEAEQYWLVKSYILIGEILAAQEDYFNARATLQSVISNSTIPELAQEAREKLEIVNQKEKSGSKVIDNE